MATNREPPPPTEAEALAQLPPELVDFDPGKWPSWQEWKRARNSALFRMGVRRLPRIQAMTKTDNQTDTTKENK